MKKVILVGIMFLMFMGVVSASSINGDYKGNPVVKLLNNGVEVVADDTPAMIYDNRTMVPIYLLKKIGVTVTWDLDKYSVDVILPSTTKDEKPTDTSSVEKLKASVQAADFYNQLESLGRGLANTATNFETVYNHYMLGTDPGITMTNAYDSLNLEINIYNDLSNKSLERNTYFTKNNLDTSNINSILNNYSKAIDYLKTSITALNNISIKYSKEDYNKYFSNASTALSYANDNQSDSWKSYKYFLGIAEN